MEFDFSKLRGRIVEKYRSQAEFARKLEKVPLTVSRKLNGENPFTSDDIKVWCELLEIPAEEIQVYFFTPKSLQTETK